MNNQKKSPSQLDRAREMARERQKETSRMRSQQMERPGLRRQSNSDPRRTMREEPRRQMHGAHPDPRMRPHQPNASIGLMEVLGMGLSAVMSAANEAKEQEYAREEANRQFELEKQKQEMELLSKIPSVCPHCGAPTNKKLNCEYCNSYLVNSTEK